MNLNLPSRGQKIEENDVGVNPTNTRQQDFLLLAKGHYGIHQAWIRNGVRILAFHALLERDYVRTTDLARVLLMDLVPLLSEMQKTQLMEALVLCTSVEEGIHHLLGFAANTLAHKEGSWVAPFPCRPDPSVLALLDGD